MATSSRPETPTRPRVAMLIPKAGQAQVLTPTPGARRAGWADTAGAAPPGPALNTALGELQGTAASPPTGCAPPPPRGGGLASAAPPPGSGPGAGTLRIRPAPARPRETW